MQNLRQILLDRHKFKGDFNVKFIVNFGIKLQKF